MRLFSTTLMMVTLAAAAAGCARAYPPPGGERDTLPPGLVSTTPAPLAVVPDFQGPVVFRFDERISERNFSEAMVTVSPLDSTMRVRRTGNEIRVELDGGWRPDRVYRVVVLPGIRDLFGNVREDPVEVVFSTGPPVPSTALAGIVMDRLTNRPAQNAVVRATRRGDDAAYTAVGDTGGFFSLRHLPMGVYEVEAFSDLNRNRRRDAAEPVDMQQVSLGSPTDTIPLVFNVLPPDTTPPRVTRAEVVDSMRVRVTFDDYFDPARSMAEATAELYALPDSTLHAAASRIVVSTVFDQERRAAAAQRPAPADTLPPPDTLAPPDPTAPPPVAAPPVVQPPTPAGQAQQQAPLPSRDLIIEFAAPLPPGSYSITVRNVVNIQGLSGGGTVRLQVPERPGG
jgi:hypothetical protein